MSPTLPTAAQVIALHDRLLATPGWPTEEPAPLDGSLWRWVQTNHRFNCRLWAEEDLARRTTVGAAEIAANKRAIDGFNQARHDATAGSIADRMSIMALKVHAMRAQTERSDVAAEHIESSRIKLARLAQQRADLGACLEALLADAQAGRAYFKVYRQFKMYNDPRFNPALVAEAKAQGG